MQQNKLVYQVNVLNVKRSQTYRKNKNEPPQLCLRKKEEKKRDIMVFSGPCLVCQICLPVCYNYIFIRTIKHYRYSFFLLIKSG